MNSPTGADVFKLFSGQGLFSSRFAAFWSWNLYFTLCTVVFESLCVYVFLLYMYINVVFLGGVLFGFPVCGCCWGFWLLGLSVCLGLLGFGVFRCFWHLLASWALWLLGFLTFVAFVAFVACGFSLFWRLWLLGDMLHNSCKQNENNRQNKRTTLMLRRTRFNTSLLRSTLWNSLFQIVNG